MKKLFYGIIGGVAAFMLFAIPNVKAETITLKNDDFQDAYDAYESGSLLPESVITYAEDTDEDGTYYHFSLKAGDYVLGEDLTDSDDYLLNISFEEGTSTLNIGGHTLDGVVYAENSTLTLSGTGTVYEAVAGKGSTVTINGNITFEGLYTEGGKLVVNNATVKSDEGPAIYVAGGSLIVNGGTFKGLGAGLALGEYNSVVLSGGTFTATDSMLFVNDSSIKTAILVIGKDENIFNTILASGKAYSETIDIKSVDLSSFFAGHSVDEDGLPYNYMYLTNSSISIVDSSSSSTEETKVTYNTLEGANQTFNTTSGANLTFRFDVDYAKFEANGKVYVDGNLVDASNYTSRSGSTIIVFNKAYTKTLANGKHTLTVDFGDGTATTNFTITGNPETGDSVYLYIITFIVSFLGIVCYTKKKANN